MNDIHTRHANYSQTYHDIEAAKRYQKKFKRSWSRQVGACWEKHLTKKALLHAGQIIRQKTDARLSELTVLDYPCGAGRLAILLASHTFGYMAGDHSPHMVSLTTEVLKQAGLGDKFIGSTVGDVRHTDLRDGCVDLATCMRLLHHFPDREDRVQILTELHRVTRHALIVTFHDASTNKQKRYIKKCAKRGKPVIRVILTPDQFKEEARAAGWTFVKSWQVSSVTSGLCIALLEQ